MHFFIWIDHKTVAFSKLLQSPKIYLSAFLEFFYTSKWKISLPLRTLQVVKSLPFHIPEAWKRYPFLAEPPCMGHYRERPPPPPSEVLCSKMKWWTVKDWRNNTIIPQVLGCEIIVHHFILKYSEWLPFWWFKIVCGQLCNTEIVIFGGVS